MKDLFGYQPPKDEKEMLDDLLEAIVKRTDPVPESAIRFINDVAAEVKMYGYITFGQRSRIREIHKEIFG